MFPRPTFYNIGYRAVAYPISAPEFAEVGLARVVSTSYIHYRQFGQFGGPVQFSAHQIIRAAAGWMIVAASQFFRMLSRTTSIAIRTTILLPHIAIVVGFRTKKQVERIYANAVIAMVADQQQPRLLSVVNIVRNAVGYVLFFFEANPSVPIGIRRASPKPAPTWLDNYPRPKAGDALRIETDNSKMRSSHAVFSLKKMVLVRASSVFTHRAGPFCFVGQS